MVMTLASGTAHDRLDAATARAAIDAAATTPPPQPDMIDGRCVVIPGGGARYFPSAWVTIRMLRELGCRLPIELWHVGPEEVDCEIRSILEPLDVCCVDATAIAERHPARFLGGWPLKAFALLHTRHRQVLLLDADNLPLADPTPMFNWPQFRSSGAVMWPDTSNWRVEDPIWSLTGVRHRIEPEVESGQLLVDRKRCWEPIALAAWMNNQHADFWYDYVYGDKDTFPLAWRKLSAEYEMPDYPPRRLRYALWQHDFEGRPIFQHRYANKWRFDSQNLHLPGVLFERQCREFLGELRRLWKSRPGLPHNHDEADEATRAEAERLCSGRWRFQGAGGGQRVMTFHLDGTIREGRTDREEAWHLFVHPYEATLCITGEDGVAWQLCRADDRWIGQAPCEHRNPARLSPLATV